MGLSVTPNYFGSMMDRQLEYDDMKEKSLYDIENKIEKTLAIDYVLALKESDVGAMQLAIIEVLTETLSVLNLRIEQEGVNREEFKTEVEKNFRATLKNKLEMKEHMTKHYIRTKIEYLVVHLKRGVSFMDELVALLVYAGYEFESGIFAAYTAYNHERDDVNVD